MKIMCMIYLCLNFTNMEPFLCNIHVNMNSKTVEVHRSPYQYSPTDNFQWVASRWSDSDGNYTNAVNIANYHASRRGYKVKVMWEKSLKEHIDEMLFFILKFGTIRILQLFCGLLLFYTITGKVKSKFEIKTLFNETFLSVEDCSIWIKIFFILEFYYSLYCIYTWLF